MAIFYQIKEKTKKNVFLVFSQVILGANKGDFEGKIVIFVTFKKLSQRIKYLLLDVRNEFSGLQNNILVRIASVCRNIQLQLLSNSSAKCDYKKANYLIIILFWVQKQIKETP